MRHTIYALLFILLLMWVIPSHATTNVGTAGAQFLKIGPGARVDSLGGAFGGLADDVTSIYWNPAGISQLEKTSLSDTHTVWLADVRYNYLAFATPIEKIGTLGASVTFLNVPDTEITTLAKPDGTGLWYSAYDTAISVAYARQLYAKESGVNLSFGINAKYIHQQIHRESARGVAIDVGTCIIRAGGAYALVCVSRTLDRKCASAVRIWQAVLRSRVIRGQQTIVPFQLQRIRHERQL